MSVNGQTFLFPGPMAGLTLFANERIEQKWSRWATCELLEKEREAMPQCYYQCSVPTSRLEPLE